MGNNLVITPVGEPFDVEAIRAYLDSQPDTLEAPGRANIYLIAAHPNVVPVYLDACLADPAVLPYGLLVDLNPEQILLIQEYAGDDQEAGALRFLRWFSQRQQFNIRIDGYADLTEQVRTQGVDSLYDESVRLMRPSWEGELLQIGFFEDFFDSRGGVQAYRLKDCISETPQRDEDELLAYLRSGHFYRAFGKPDEELHDQLDPDTILDIEPALFTDGAYVWPSDLPYYVEKYHVHLPRAFLHHARKNGWQVPAKTDVRSMKMIDV